MTPLTLSSPSLNRLFFLTSRYSRSPFLRNFNSLPFIHRKLPHSHLLGARCEASGSFTAKSSKEIRKARAEAVVDEKLTALRQQFSKPGVGIDAYIIPSQDAHQVWFFFKPILDSNENLKLSFLLLLHVITVNSMCFMNIYVFVSLDISVLFLLRLMLLFEMSSVKG